MLVNIGGGYSVHVRVLRTYKYIVILAKLWLEMAAAKRIAVLLVGILSIQYGVRSTPYASLKFKTMSTCPR
jgi:hypothetical protein